VQIVQGEIAKNELDLQSFASVNGSPIFDAFSSEALQYFRFVCSVGQASGPVH
jgi:hypothetical protein